MAGYISETERRGILSVFEQSFETWCREVVIYKEPRKTIVTPQPPTTNNAFGFGDTQQDPTVTYSEVSITGVFKAILKDAEIESAFRQATDLSPEIQARILTNPISMKVRADAFAFLEDGPNEKIVDTQSGITYFINGVAGYQTYMGSSYWIYPLRKVS